MRQNKEKYRLVAVFVTAALLLAAIFVSAQMGSADVSVLSLLRQRMSGVYEADYDSMAYIFTQVRLPRILLCTLTGLALGLSGCVMQSLMRNPLASPYTLGVSNGAAFGAALAMLWGGGTLGAGFSFLGYSAVAMNAFVFGCLSLAIVCAASKLCGGNLSVLILTGSAIDSLFSAGISILKYLSSAEALKNLDIWLMGGFWASNWKSVLTVLPFCLLSLLFTLRFAWDFNAMNAGESIAVTLGVHVKLLKAVSLILVTLTASVSIAFSGVIGFIGLVAPHIARSLVGVDNRKLIPESALMGALVLLVSDTVARTVLLPKEIPVGIITSLIGVPFFIFILAGRRKQLWGNL